MFYAANTISTNIDSWRKFEVNDLYNELKRQALDWFNTESDPNVKKDIASLQTFLDHLSTRNNVFLENSLRDVVTYSINQKFDFMNWLNVGKSTTPLIKRLISNPATDINFTNTGYSAFETSLRSELDSLRSDFTNGNIISQVSIITNKIKSIFDTEIQKYGLTQQLLPSNSYSKTVLDDTISSINSVLDSSTTYYNDKYPFKTYSNSLQTVVSLLNSKMTSRAFLADIASIAETHAANFLRDKVGKAFKSTASTREWVRWQHDKMNTIDQLDTLFTTNLKSIITGFNTSASLVDIHNKVVITKLSDNPSTHKTTLMLTFEVAVNGVVRDVSTTVSVDTYDYPVETIANYINTHITGPNLFIPIMGDKTTLQGIKTLAELEALQIYYDGTGLSDAQYKAFIKKLKDIKTAHSNLKYVFEIVPPRLSGQNFKLKIHVEHSGLNSWESSRSTFDTEISMSITNEMDAIATNIIHEIDKARANPVIGTTITEFLYKDDLVNSDGTPKALNYLTSLQASVTALSSMDLHGAEVHVIGKSISSPAYGSNNPLLVGEIWLTGSGPTTRRYQFQLPISKSDNPLDDFVSSIAQAKHVDYGHTVVLEASMAGSMMSESDFMQFIPSWQGKKDFAAAHHITVPTQFEIKYNPNSRSFFTDFEVSDANGHKRMAHVTIKKYLFDHEVAQLRTDVEGALTNYERVLGKYQAGDPLAAAQLSIITQYRVDFLTKLNAFPQDKVPSSFKEEMMNQISTFKKQAYLGALIASAQSGVLDKLIQRYGGLDKIPEDIMEKLKNISEDTLNKLKNLSPERFVEFLANGQLMDHLDTFVDSLSHLLNMETVMTESFKMGVVGTAGVMGVASMGAGVTAVRIAGANRKARKQKNKTKISSSKGLFITSSLVALTTALGSVGMMLYVFISQGGF